jgi:hypothetical protein
MCRAKTSRSSRFRTFGSNCYAKIHGQFDTLHDRAEEMRFLGMAPHDDVTFNHVYRPRDRRHFTSDEVDFVETDLQLPAYAADMTAEFRLLEENLDPQAIDERVDAQSIIDADEDYVERRVPVDPSVPWFCVQEGCFLPCKMTPFSPHLLDTAP